MIRIMLIDDHPVVRAGLRAVLNSFGDVEVVAEADNGNAEVPDGVDVVVTDIQMPGASGIDLTRRLTRAGGPPVLILTTYDTQSDVVAAMEAGALGYLLKDAPEEDLHDAVLKAARRERVLSPQAAGVLADRVMNPNEALSIREIEILQALKTGASNRQIADQLFISLATVKTHLIHIYEKLGVDNRTAAVQQAQDRRII
ncbi:response regulator transcription factor [Corynebacterium sp. HMSC29G08]|uniref:response regulator transcription factor n=1 Tax=Corynebacterium sp. HMSC29G08 TaxID=1581069 RepID=UPI0008A2D851|nr:response regulator transcription factor [Corynebacterium sp. HMSC29G08]OFT83551.1 DNA-binding response regulator [Corynebacterium sp. HMSC29G08]